MDEKKVKEAIEFLQRQICTLDAQKEYDEYCNPVYDETLDLAIGLYETAIKALEKQLPKKPDIMDYILGDINFKCPTCKSEYICEKGYEHFYCPNCGQKIKWSE